MPKWRRGDTKLAGDELFTAMDAKMSSLGDAGLTILELMDHYDCDVVDFLTILAERGFNVSFSKVKYRDIAPRVDLQSHLQGRDMLTFDIYRARIPNSLFRDIISDVQVMMKQYGDPVYHKNEEARSRFLAPLFNRIVSLSDLTILNTLESIIPGRMTTKGRIEYHFSVFGGLSILVIEVKFTLGTADERLDAIAQVIAECDACNYANDRFIPLMAVPYLRSTPTSIPGQRLTVADYMASPIAFIGSLRPICETLFYFFLLSFRTGVSAWTERSSLRGKTEQHTRKSFPNWVEALADADKALSLAMDAAEKAHTRDNSIDQVTERALFHLRASLASVPTTHKMEIDLLRL